MTENSATSSKDLQSLKRHGYVGLLVVLGLFGGLLAWAALTEISGAVVAQGILVVQDNAKRVQHPEGGTVAQLMVRNEDHVAKGQLLAVLDQTAIAASLEISEAQLREAYAKEARLTAEIEGRSDVVLSDVALDAFDAVDLNALLDLEQRVLTVRLDGRAGRIAQLNEQITQLERQREGLQLQKIAIERQLEVVALEILDFESLYDKRLIAVSRGTALDKELASTQGELGRVVAAIAESHAIAAERALQIEQINDEFLTTALADLQDTRRIIAEAGQQRIANRDRLVKTEIRAPQAGIVHESVLHTVGGVAASGETLMLIVPTDDPLLVNVRIAPIDIDKVVVGQKAVLRFSGLDPRSTPELNALISRIAPDATQDTTTGLQYYATRIAIPDEQLARMPAGSSLIPGMPVEAFVQTGDRTVLSYLIRPIVEQLSLALRE
ncbi:HlyD family type I secretion periplasmic adaptor subunit [Devosia sp.]|uniref:HlyD family type I secretion periplasmic adaptor subunit n=1 Tax=Devosia sp. TaxID=1871048 RepID=UPI002736A3C5|nr:HlyD family type I secretion periplasmic adaptor subunit [Devosia sp.]MDP2781873.1 HlyD family type I secretion periplasmic adaptor subunit [Devosia sp.]